MNTLLRCVLIGAATGGRSCTGLAALTLTASPAAAAQPDKSLSAAWVRKAVTLIAALELVADQLPNAPGRLAPAGLGARVAAAVAAATIVVRRDQERDPGARPFRAVAAPVAVAVAAAAGAAWLGADWRAAAARRFGGDHLGAALEDAGVISLAWLGARD